MKRSTISVSHARVTQSVILLISCQVTLKMPEEEHSVNDRDYAVRYTPLGVVVAICAWNCTSNHIDVTDHNTDA